jgi:nitroimidazol reductase NimA-like FMN-containing flavoprotein (pyridoxamine 5'-phosphate oxidase superfamily)
MYAEMRRKEKQLSVEETIAVLNAGEYGIMSTVGKNGYPYSVPVNYVYHDGSIFFHCAAVGQKLENIQENPCVSFAVVTDVELIPDGFNTRFKSVIVFGKAKEIFDEEKKAVLLALVEKFSPEYMEAGKKYIEKAWAQTRVVKIEIEHMTGKGKK